jgi:hypothetical protein
MGLTALRGVHTNALFLAGKNNPLSLMMKPDRQSFSLSTGWK